MTSYFLSLIVVLILALVIIESQVSIGTAKVEV